MPDSVLRDWERWVDQRLADGGWDRQTRDRVIADVAAMLEACEREALDAGVEAEAALAQAERLVPSWEALARRLETEMEAEIDAEIQADPAEIEPLIAAGHRRRRRAPRLLAGLGRDLRSAVRAMAQAPGFSTVVAVTLALGIGANAAMFSLVDAALLAPLPYPEPEQLVRIFSDNQELGIEREGVSSGDVVEWRRRTELLRGIGAWYTMGRTLSAVGASARSPERSDGSGAQAAELIEVAQVSEDFFPVLGASPLLGRTFTPEETAAATFNSTSTHTGADPVAVLSHRAWVNRFAADPGVLDRTLVLDRQVWRIVGVMPEGFDFPHPGVELWIPWSFEGDRPHDQRYVQAIARLDSGVTVERAEAHLDGLAAALAEELPESNRGWGVVVEPLREEMVRGARATLLVLLAAVAVVLLVACSNIACLQLSRLGARQREMELRLALGASRLRIARQLLVENLLLALLGGAAALLAAAGIVRLVVAFGAEALPRLGSVEVDLRVLAVTTLVSVACGLFFGLVPLGASPRSGLAAMMGEASGWTAGSAPRWERLRRGLVVGELAMAVVLLAAGGLLLRSFLRLHDVDVGFRPERVAVLPITLDNHEYRTGADARAYYRDLFARLEAVPGVESVGAATALPMSPIGPDFDRPVWPEGERPAPGSARHADIRMATPGYFETLGVPVLRGRAFDARDTPDSPPVLIVNQRLARDLWPGEDPLGKQLVVDYSRAGTYPYQVVGVVGDVRFYGRRAEPRREVYFPHAQRSYLILNVAVRTAGDPGAAAPELRRAVLDVDPMQPAYRVAPLDRLVASSIARDRFAVSLVGGFGLVALVLALVGIVGVLSYHVAQRVPEVGVRAALGATRRELVALVLGSGMRLAFSGLVVGVLASAAVTRVLDSLLFEVSPLDPVTFVCVLLATGGAALVACWVPARRAARVDPIDALRHE